MSFLSVLICEVERCNVICCIIICIYVSGESHLLFSDDYFLFFRSWESEVVAKKNILATYEQDSKHLINLKRFGIFCSKNTFVELRATMAHIIDVKQVMSTCKYLGFPSMIGWRKKVTFKYMQDQIWSRISSYARLNLE